LQALVRPFAEHDAHQLIAPMCADTSPGTPSTIDSVEAFERLAAGSPAELARLAQLEAGSRQLWWDILERCPQHAVWVAANRSLPEDVVSHLAGHDSVLVRAALASGPCVPEDVMQRLAHDKDELVRVRVACNRKASRSVLAALVADPCPVVSVHAQARLVHDNSGVMLPASYLERVSVDDLRH
jgi:hypothetical protein